ncbi:hypothetical protein BO71DRAFT_421800 [Aspergillus ellipticus CBS 707.79]|uniref:Uncharacterized protein n=1 Tax=Aspergillus ellipticus CBS 707.79 TaxID=1448320 RepID=A0A319D218_9EURO|nr:hypothetical protein BO71DRAFT_421800 [Aspergillus ellipticus CBS 707.79]
MVPTETAPGVLEYASFFCQGSLDGKGCKNGSCHEKHQVQAGIFLGDLRETGRLFQEHWGINLREIALLSSQLMSSYHSRIVNHNGQTCLEIYYNISESLSYVASGTDPLDSSPTLHSEGPGDMVIDHLSEPLYFRHNLTTGQATYILLDAHGELRHFLCKLGQLVGLPSTENLHPLAIHSAILFYILSTRMAEINNLVRWLLWIETQVNQGLIFEITDDRFSRYIQLLHKMSRTLITLEHSTERDTSTINHLLHDHSQLWKLSVPHQNSANISKISQDCIRDDLFRLRDFCKDRQRLILNLRQRTHNFITLLYNLITGHDSAINLRIATQNAQIANEARKDSLSMKIIAAVTLLYLPATFISSLFGTNLVGLSIDGKGSSFVVSPLWWVYVVFAVPLKGLTMGGFLGWRWWRERGGGRGKRQSHGELSMEV